LYEKYVTVSIEDIPVENWKNTMENISPETMFIAPGLSVLTKKLAKPIDFESLECDKV